MYRIVMNQIETQKNYVVTIFRNNIIFLSRAVSILHVGCKMIIFINFYQKKDYHESSFHNIRWVLYYNQSVDEFQILLRSPTRI